MTNISYGSADDIDPTELCAARLREREPSEFGLPTRLPHAGTDYQGTIASQTLVPKIGVGPA